MQIILFGGQGQNTPPRSGYAPLYRSRTAHALGVTRPLSRPHGSGVEVTALEPEAPRGRTRRGVLGARAKSPPARTARKTAVSAYERLQATFHGACPLSADSRRSTRPEQRETMQHILVVGAGYIGSHMVWLLGRRGFGILAAAKVAMKARRRLCHLHSYYAGRWASPWRPSARTRSAHRAWKQGHWGKLSTPAQPGARSHRGGTIR